MINILSGAIVGSAGVAVLWYFVPKNGQVHPLALRPLLDSIIPVTIVSLLGIGVALTISGFF